MADTTNRLAGSAYLTVDGQRFMLVGDFAYRLSGVERETLVGMDGVHGYSEKPIAGSISGTIRNAGGLSLADLNAMSNVTVMGESANGKMIIGTGMWMVEKQDANVDAGTIPVHWESGNVQEA